MKNTRLLLIVKCLGFLACSPLSGVGLQLHELVQTALEHNNELKASQQAVATTCHLKQAQRLSFQPEIRAVGGAYSENLDIREDNFKYGYLEANWNLFQGGRDVATLGILQAQEEIATLNCQKEAKILVNEISKAFYEILFFDAAVEIYRGALKQNEVYSTQAKRRWESGLTTETDLTEFQLRQDSLLTDLSTLEGERQWRHAQLVTLVGCEAMPTDFDLEGEFLEAQPLDPNSLYEQALCNREEKRVALLRQRIRAFEQRQVDAEFLPSVDVRASYGYEPDDPDQRSHGGRVGIEVSFPLFDGGVHAQRRYAALSRRRGEEFTHCHLDKTLQREVTTAASKIQLTLNNLKRAEARLDKVTHYWDLTYEEYQRGVKNSPDLAAAADGVLEGRIKLLQWQRDYSLAIVDLSAALGGLPPGTRTP